MRRPIHLAPAAVVALVVALVLALCVLVGSPARAEEPPPPGPVLKDPPATRAPDGYTPPAGVKVNNPLGSRARRRAITTHVLRSIKSTPGRQTIRFASWNIRSNEMIDALIRAHRRGVSVRVVVDRGNANPENVNGGVDRLETALAGYGNAGRTPQYRSSLTRCVAACRGPRGIAHSKFFLFSRAGKASMVVINGSHNATDIAASHQWNDVFTVTGRSLVWRDFTRVFDEMARDNHVAQGYVATTAGPFTTQFHPWRGSGTGGDPVLRYLGDTSCANAGGVGTRGRTRIRIAMTSWHGARGIAIAKRLKTMHTRGCDVRIVYAVAGNEVLRILRRGGRGAIPMRQIVQDFNSDGVYDRYLHLKAMTVSGRYRGRANQHVTFNGSANWSPAALVSDEAGFRVYGAGPKRAYENWINYLYAHPPYNPGARRAVTSGSTAERRTVAGADPVVSPAAAAGALPPAQVEKIARARGVDPYAAMQVD